MGISSITITRHRFSSSILSRSRLGRWNARASRDVSAVVETNKSSSVLSPLSSGASSASFCSRRILSTAYNSFLTLCALLLAATLSLDMLLLAATLAEDALLDAETLATELALDAEAERDDADFGPYFEALEESELAEALATEEAELAETLATEDAELAEALATDEAELRLFFASSEAKPRLLAITS